MRKYIVLTIALLGIAVAAAQTIAQAGTNCRTSCFGQGAARTCNTYCN